MDISRILKQLKLLPMDAELKRELRRLNKQLTTVDTALGIEVESQTVNLVEGDNTIVPAIITAPVRNVSVWYNNENVACNVSLSGGNVVVNVAGSFTGAVVNIVAFD